VSRCTAVDATGGEVSFDPNLAGTPTPVTIDNNDALSAISCPSARQCTAIDNDGLDVTFDPTDPGAVTPVTVSAGDAFSSLACPSARQCTAVDDDGRELTFDPRLVTAPAPVPVAVDGGVALSAVACPSAVQCTAVDEDGREVTFDPSPATQSQGRLTGVAARRPKLELSFVMGSSAPPIETITVSLPQGLAFSGSRKALEHTIVIRGAGAKKLRFAAGTRARTLRVRLAAATTQAQVTIPSAAISVTRSLAARVREGTVKTLTVLVSATGAGHQKIELRLKLRV
jgi:hypothetical protein